MRSSRKGGGYYLSTLGPVRPSARASILCVCAGTNAVARLRAGAGLRSVSAANQTTYPTGRLYAKLKPSAYISLAPAQIQLKL